MLSQFALESVFAHSKTIELPHDKAVFLNEIKDSLIFVRNPLEPFVLVNVALDNVYLSIQNIMEMFAFVEHGQTVSVFIKSIAFLDSYGNRHEREAVQSFLPSAWKGFLAVIAENKEIRTRPWKACCIRLSDKLMSEPSDCFMNTRCSKGVFYDTGG